MTAASFCPNGTVEANGQLLQIRQYAQLFALYGARYGGDGRTNFALPDLRTKMLTGTGQLSGSAYSIGLGQTFGQESITLDATTLPIHTHGATFTQGSSSKPITVNIQASSNIDKNTNQPSNTNNYIAASSNNNGANMWASTSGSAPVNLAGVSVSGDTTTTSVTVANTGAGAPISVVPPQLGLKYCIVVKGIYPMRP